MPTGPFSFTPPDPVPTPDPATAWQHFSEEGFPDPLLDLIAERFRLLGEPVRLKLLAILGQGERSVSELVTLTGASQPNISKHLHALAHGGLVQRRKVGTSIIYTVADPSIRTLCSIVCAGVQERLHAQARLVVRPAPPSAAGYTE